jgi:hypothetical protein
MEFFSDTEYGLRRRQDKQYIKLGAAGKDQSKIVTAVARELLGKKQRQRQNQPYCCAELTRSLHIGSCDARLPTYVPAQNDVSVC